MLLESLFEPIVQQLPDVTDYYVALSGGLDSHALLCMCHDYFTQHQLPIRLHALHVNHQLHAEADDWQAHCHRLCKALDIPLASIKLTINHQQGQSLEAIARHARYAALRPYVQPQACLFTAHHQDDQAETVILQLLRGAGPKGLAAMPLLTRFADGYLARPLLSLTRQQIKDYAKENQLHWLEDSSNHDVAFDRNFLRHQVIPLLKQRWPSLSQTLGRAARHCGQADTILSQVAAGDVEHLCQDKQTLSLTRLKLLTEERQRNALRFWLWQHKLPLPNEKKIIQILTTIVTAREDATPCVTWPGGEVRRYRHELYALVPLVFPDEHYVAQWNLQDNLVLPNGLGVLTAERHRGQGFVLAKGQSLQVRFNVKGLACQLTGRQGTKSLKKLYQQWQVPPWQRAQTPLLFVDNTLVTVVGRAINAPYDNTQADQLGWVIRLITT